MRRPNVLVIDDDPTQRLLVAETLSQAGVCVDEALDGEEGLEKVSAHTPDLILLDVVMPGLNGFEVCELLRKDEATVHVPVVMVTACEDYEAIENAYTAGATHFLSKPINWDLLAHQVKYVLRNSRLEGELRRAKRKADVANKAKSRFLRNMSHELRSPLHAIIGLSELLGDASIASCGKQTEALRSQINASGKHLLDIVEDLLCLSQIEAGKHILDEKEVLLAEAFATPLQIAETLARDRNVAVTARIDTGDLMVRADPRALQQIAINLLTNAIKFSRPGGAVAFELEARDGGEVAISVTDAGVGMSADEIETALKPFERTRSRLSRKNGGAGLGLPLTASLIEMHGGRLVIDSLRGEGTAATVVLPASRRVAPEPIAAAS